MNNYFFRDISKEDNFNFYIQLGFLISDIPIFITLFFVKAYYGKFFNDYNKYRSFIPTISSRTSWIIQECPCVFITIFFLYKYFNSTSIINSILLLAFLFHYIHRTFIFPFVIHSSKNNPLEITLMAFTFCFFNAIMINRSIFYYTNYDHDFWLYYIYGLITFICGMYINIFSDYSMIKQRNAKKEQEGGSKYIIPKGFMYELISCPNYFGELIEWLGFFVLSNTFSGLVFFVSTFANLFPRAIQYHQWYKTKFKEEFSTDKDLANRKAIVPFLI
jgi:protein-S-isoprenylcysteine O-methyltransferase Ste14